MFTSTFFLAIIAGTVAGLAASWLVVKRGKPEDLLTYDEIDVLWEKQKATPFKTHAEDRMDFARAVEAACRKPLASLTRANNPAAPSFIDGGLVGGNKGTEPTLFVIVRKVDVRAVLEGSSAGSVRWGYNAARVLSFSTEHSANASLSSLTDKGEAYVCGFQTWQLHEPVAAAAWLVGKKEGGAA